MDGLVDEADAVEILKVKLRESHVNDKDEPKPCAAKSRAAVPPPSAASAPVKVKQEPLSDDDAPPSTSHGASSKAHGMPSVPKPHPAGKSGPAATSTANASSSSTFAAKAATLPAPLVHHKASKSKLAVPRQNATPCRVDKKGNRAAHTPLDVDTIEISSDEPHSEDE